MQEFFKPITDELNCVEENLYNKINKFSPTIVNKIAGNLISSGGKRIRPTLVLLSASAVDNNSSKSEDIINLATIVEIVHMASLIHDDVIDEAEIRRNKPTAHKLLGNKIAILAGDHLLSIAFHLLSEVIKRKRDNTILKVFAKTMQEMCEGAIQEVNNSQKFSERDYLRLIKKKTAYLFSTSCYVGAKCSNATISEADLMATYGMNFGITFQIIDDLLDFLSFSEKLGKPVLSDVNSFKVTLPVINLFKVAKEEEKKFIKEYFEKRENNTENLIKIIEIMDKYKSFEKTKYKAKQYAEEAKRAIKFLPKSPYKESLTNLLLYSLERKI